MTRIMWISALAGGTSALLLAATDLAANPVATEQSADQSRSTSADVPAVEATATEALPAEVPQAEAVPAEPASAEAAPAAAEANAAVPAGDAAASATDDDPVICKKTEPTGTRVRPKKVCLPRSQWAAGS